MKNNNHIQKNVSFLVGLQGDWLRERYSLGKYFERK